MTEHEARDLLALALGRPVAPDEQPRRGVSNDWDSLHHVELMFLIEERTGSMPTPEALARIVDVSSLAGEVSLLERQ